jgi:hypothetical protein
MSDTTSAFEAMPDDEFGKLVLFHSDRVQRDDRTWELVTSEELVTRARDVLRHMQSVNNLARGRRTEELENARLRHCDEDPAGNREWRKLKAEHAAWQARAGRFSHRVNMALHEIKLIMRDRMEGTPQGFLQEMLSAVFEHRGTVLADDYEPTSHDELLWKVADSIAEQIDWVYPTP